MQKLTLLLIIFISIGFFVRIKPVIIPSKSIQSFRVDQTVSVLEDGEYCLSTIAWYDRKIISHQLAYEDNTVYNDLSEPVYVWFVVSLNDSVKMAQMEYAEAKLNNHISKISTP